MKADSAGLTLAGRASRTAVVSAVDYVSRLATAVVVTPMLVAALGPTLFGTWEMLQRVAGYLVVTDGRPMDTLRLVLARQQVAGHDAERRRTIGAAVVIWVLCLPAVVAAGAAIVWAAPLITGAAPARVGAVRTAAALLIANLVVLTLAALPEAVLFGVNEAYRRLGVVAGMHLLGGVLSVAAVRADRGVSGLAAVPLIVTLVTSALLLAIVYRHVSWFGVERPSRREVVTFGRLTGWTVGGDLVARLLLASDVVILGALTSAAVVTPYVLTGYAPQAVVGLGTLLLGAVAPGLTGLVGAREVGRAAHLRHELLAGAWLVGTVAGVAVLLWNETFLSLWVGASLYAGRPVDWLLSAIMLQTLLIRVDAIVLNALLALRARVLVSAGAAVAACICAAALVGPFGIVGLCAGLLAGRLVQSLWFPLVAARGLASARAVAPGAVARAATATVVLWMLAALGATNAGEVGLTRALVGLVLTVGVAVPLAASLGLSAGMRTRLTRRAGALAAPRSVP